MSKDLPVRILIVEDEAHLAEGLLFNLRAEGYSVELALDGETALERLLPRATAKAAETDRRGKDRTRKLDQQSEQIDDDSRVGVTVASPALGGSAPFSDSQSTDDEPAAAEFDLVLLDVMLPGKSGFDVVSELRSGSIYIPVLMLTARGRPEDVLRGLDAGADDYLPKPFDLSILLARIHVLLRRMRWQTMDLAPSSTADAGSFNADEGEQTYSFAGRTIDFSMLELTAKGTAIRLTLMEADFLRYLSLHPFRIIPRKELLEQVWRVHEDTDTRAIDNFVVRLRRYLEDEPANPVYLKTVRGVGYRFLPNGE